ELRKGLPWAGGLPAGWREALCCIDPAVSPHPGRLGWWVRPLASQLLSEVIQPRQEVGPVSDLPAPVSQPRLREYIAVQLGRRAGCRRAGCRGGKDGERHVRHARDDLLDGSAPLP